MEFAVPLDQGSMMFRPMSFQGTDVVKTHAHNFPHVTFIPKGRALIEELDSEFGKVVRAVEKGAGGFVLIKAHVWHRITKLEPDTFGICVYAHRNPQGQVVQEWDGWGPAYV